MPEGMTAAPGAPSPLGGAPAPMPAAGGQASGPGGATAPVPNRGSEFAALAKIAALTKLIEAAALGLPMGSEAAHGVREGIMKITKVLPAAEMSPGTMSTALQGAAMHQRQMAPQIAAMRAAQPAMPGA